MLLSIQGTKCSPMTLSFFIICFVDMVDAVPKQSTLAVQTVGISNAVRIDNSLVEVYQLSKAQLVLIPMRLVKMFNTILGIRSLSGVPKRPLAPVFRMTW